MASLMRFSMKLINTSGSLSQERENAVGLCINSSASLKSIFSRIVCRILPGEGTGYSIIWALQVCVALKGLVL